MLKVISTAIFKLKFQGKLTKVIVVLVPCNLKRGVADVLREVINNCFKRVYSIVIHNEVLSIAET